MSWMDACMKPRKVTICLRSMCFKDSLLSGIKFLWQLVSPARKVKHEGAVWFSVVCWWLIRDWRGGLFFFLFGR